MKTLLRLAIKSLWNRKLTSILTVLTIGLSVCLLFTVERVRSGAKESFSNTISQTDLIVGAKGGTIQLLLYSVFRIGSATDNLSYESYEEFKNHPAVKWTIPYSLGDSHRGFRVVGTDHNFFRHYRFHGDQFVEFEEGGEFASLFEVVLGGEVAEKYGYKVNQDIVLAHGVADITLQDHEDKPFKVVGILKKTGTPIDRSLYISLQGLEAIHVDWEDGAPPMPGQEISKESVEKRELPVHQITAFLLRTKARIETLSLQREINEYPDEALMAIIPGVALSDMWEGIRFAEQALSLVSFFVVLVGMLGMLISLYNSLNERRREMAILRSIGAGPRLILGLLVFESFILTVSGVVLGVLAMFFLLTTFQNYITTEFGLFLQVKSIVVEEFYLAGILIVLGVLMGAVPAMRAYFNTLSDGLTPKT